MPGVRVKICGVRDEAALDAAVEGGADWVGLVFFDRSPRHVGVGTAAALVRRLRGRIPAVGLFVRPNIGDVARVLAEAPLDILQVYGSVDQASAVRRQFGLPVWLARGVGEASELPTTTDLDGTDLDGLVIEAKPPPNSDRPGGNGTRLNWSMLRGWKAPTPWLLAGGLTAETVAAAIQASGAVSVDVSSGVERTVGGKDPDLIRAFIAAAKAA